MAKFHPKTWDDGIMPLSAFSPEKQAQIAEQVAAPRPPPRWLPIAGGQIQSRAWWEWHWSRGKKLRHRPDPRPQRKKIPEDVRFAVYERDGYKCLHCGSEERLTLDHIHPWSLGGEDTLENLQTLCRPCNSRKGARV